MCLRSKRPRSMTNALPTELPRSSLPRWDSNPRPLVPLKNSRTTHQAQAVRARDQESTFPGLISNEVPEVPFAPGARKEDKGIEPSACHSWHDFQGRFPTIGGYLPFSCQGPSSDRGQSENSDKALGRYATVPHGTGGIRTHVSFLQKEVTVFCAPVVRWAKTTPTRPAGQPTSRGQGCFLGTGSLRQGDRDMPTARHRSGDPADPPRTGGSCGWEHPLDACGAIPHATARRPRGRRAIPSFRRRSLPEHRETRSFLDAATICAQVAD